jgi:hypothetical protein
LNNQKHYEKRKVFLFGRVFEICGRLLIMNNRQEFQVKVTAVTIMYGDRWKFLSQVVEAVMRDPYITTFVIVDNGSKNEMEIKEGVKVYGDRVVVLRQEKNLGSADQGSYLATRKAIVDDIQRMQSGAALTAEEQSFYADYLPGRLSESFFLGQDSLKKIENFETIMNNKLDNKLRTYGLSIYGYSKVKIGDKEYTVGDLITNASGQVGRVNSDGSITLVQ